MGRKKKIKPIDVMKELGTRKNSQPDYLEFVEAHYLKFNTIEKAQALLWCINISRVSDNPELYKKLYYHFRKYNYKNPLAHRRVDHLEAFLWDNGIKTESTDCE